MIEAAAVRPGDRVLEVGAGSGYAAAVLSQIAHAVYAIERHRSLVQAARARFARLGYDNVEIRVGDGTLGWGQAAPFDAIIVSAGGPKVPLALKQQLAIGGSLVIPVGASGRRQNLLSVTRTEKAAFEEENLGLVKFVPLIGKGGWREGGGLEDRPRRRVRTQDLPEPIVDRVKVLPAFRDAERDATDDRASEKRTGAGRPVKGP
jgi:protein-L-isoaspartate(D-aspartate) O-methyltransferase